MTNKFRIAINSMALDGKIPAGDPRWAQFNDSFENLTLNLFEIIDAITTGHAYTAWHDGRRKHENFICAQHIAIDMDTDDERSSFGVLEQHYMVRTYGGIMHTTPSHTTEAPRARIIFLLDRCIETVDAFRSAATFLSSMFDGADEACNEASRFLYGCKDAQIWFTDNVLPLDDLRGMYRNWRRRQPAPRRPSQTSSDFQPKDVTDWTDKLIEPVRHAPEGDRNNTLNRQAFLAGKDITQGRIDERDIITQLIRVGQSIGLSEVEATKTVYSGVRSGKVAM